MLDTPDGLDLNEIDHILKETHLEPDLVKRVDTISGWFLGRPYAAGLLGGGPELPEVLRVPLNEFDCVTYVETVLALGLAQTTAQVIETVSQIRYADGKIDWLHRNHYMTDWVRNNVARGFFSKVTRAVATDEKTCTLEVIPGLPSKTERFTYFAKQKLHEVLELVRTGDLILFVSIKDTLDVFHIGLLIKREHEVMLRHATRTAGAVIEQPLTDFVSQNEMAGLVLLRPKCRP